jgi:putative endonuclease
MCPGVDPRMGVGRVGEALAEAHLVRLGYRLIERRFRLRNGEIDLVMADGRTVVFVEVRRRRSERGGDPLESIDARKRGRLIRAARVFLARRGLGESPCRFDVVAIRDREGGRPEIRHISDAFRAE